MEQSQDKLVRVYFNEKIEICSLGINAEMKLTPTSIAMLKEFTTVELNERLNLCEEEKLTENDYELQLSKTSCKSVAELCEQDDGCLLVVPNKNVSELISRQNLLESLLELNSELESKCTMLQNDAAATVAGDKEKPNVAAHKKSSSSRTKRSFEIEIEKLNLKLERISQEMEHDRRKEAKSSSEQRLEQEDQWRKQQEQNKLVDERYDRLARETREEMAYLKEENRNLIDVLTSLSKAVCKAESFVESYNKRLLVEKFVRRRCALDPSLSTTPTSGLNMTPKELEQHGLAAADLICMLEFQPGTLSSCENDIAVTLLSSANKNDHDSWSRIFKATFDSTPEQSLDRLDTENFYAMF